MDQTRRERSYMVKQNVSGENSTDDMKSKDECHNIIARILNLSAHLSSGILSFKFLYSKLSDSSSFDDVRLKSWINQTDKLVSRFRDDIVSVFSNITTIFPNRAPLEQFSLRFSSTVERERKLHNVKTILSELANMTIFEDDMVVKRYRSVSPVFQIPKAAPNSKVEPDLKQYYSNKENQNPNEQHYRSVKSPNSYNEVTKTLFSKSKQQLNNPKVPVIQTKNFNLAMKYRSECCPIAEVFESSLEESRSSINSNTRFELVEKIDVEPVSKNSQKRTSFFV